MTKILVAEDNPAKEVVEAVESVCGKNRYAHELSTEYQRRSSGGCRI
ncbi:MAG TPA: hypothetical protein VN872_11675 [Candidatus Acidoferrum sp.]|nr:hypothetical protein [Candidatus Acidoferrum sp.]